jgi:hypothetical protein
MFMHFTYNFNDETVVYAQANEYEPHLNAVPRRYVFLSSPWGTVLRCVNVNCMFGEMFLTSRTPQNFISWEQMGH